MVTRESLQVGDHTLALTLARGSGEGAAVVMMPSAFGVAADVEAQLADFARHARLAVAFDPFSRDDPGVIPYGDMKRVMARLGALDRERTYRDLRAVIDWAREASPRVILLGVCFGGPFVVRAAADGAADGVVAWHPSRLEDHLEGMERIRCPLRLHLGSEDPLTPPNVVAELRSAVAPLPDARMEIHPGATHGFTHRSAPVYQPAAEHAAMVSVAELSSKS